MWYKRITNWNRSIHNSVAVTEKMPRESSLDYDKYYTFPKVRPAIGNFKVACKKCKAEISTCLKANSNLKTHLSVSISLHFYIWITILATVYYSTRRKFSLQFKFERLIEIFYRHRHWNLNIYEFFRPFHDSMFMLLSLKKNITRHHLIL